MVPAEFTLKSDYALRSMDEVKTTRFDFGGECFRVVGRRAVPDPFDPAPMIDVERWRLPIPDPITHVRFKVEPEIL